MFTKCVHAITEYPLLSNIKLIYILEEKNIKRSMAVIHGYYTLAQLNSFK